jgi:hypothetical protein
MISASGWVRKSSSVTVADSPALRQPVDLGVEVEAQSPTRLSRARN